MRIEHPADRGELRKAMALLMDRSGLSPGQVDDQLDAIMQHAETRGLDLRNCLLAYEGNRVTAACLAIDQPGRTSSLFLPVHQMSRLEVDHAAALLARAAEEARGRDIRLMQALVDPESRQVAEAFRGAGFEHLTRLEYLERDAALALRVPGDRGAPALPWMTYDESRHSLFSRVIQATYEGSLDCVSLNTRRALDDVLTSHRATGRFDPKHWLLGLDPQGEPLGVLLLAFVPERWACEVVYLGLLPAWRGRGFGLPLMHKTHQTAREMAASSVSLTVDARNRPARKLYDACGFQETSSRDAWIHFL